LDSDFLESRSRSITGRPTIESQQPEKSPDPAPSPAPDITSLLNQALALHQTGRLAEAEPLYRTVLRAQPSHFDTLHLLGLLHYQRGEHAEAVRRIDLALLINPNAIAAHNSRGAALKELNRTDEALASYGNAIALDPTYADAYYNRGNVLRERQQFEDALADYDRAIALKPDHIDAFNNRGTALRALRRFEEALASFDRAIALGPENADALHNRGNALNDLRRFEEALASFDHAIALKPNLAEAFDNRSTALLNLKRIEEALASYDQAIAIKPDYAEGYRHRAFCRLLVGRCIEGWADYEWRWKTAQMVSERRNFKPPQWYGSTDIAGKTILLHSEQGFGDTLMAARYVRPVIARGARVVLELPAALVPLLAEIDGVAQLVTKHHPLPGFDLHCPLMSLPLAFGTTLNTIPADVPYLSVPQAHAEKWLQRLPRSGRPRVGITWTGNPDHKRDHERSIELRRMLPLLSRTDVDFFSVQKFLREGDSEILRANQIANLGDAIETFADMAAMISNLDLVITVDTSVAHLAGALGKPVWILLPFIPDWRWLLDRHDSPWYPSAQLFRQSRVDDWEGVVGRVSAALSLRAAGGPNDSPSG
jgi:tetratricopeptide (TPR) repeat protein